MRKNDFDDKKEYGRVNRTSNRAKAVARPHNDTKAMQRIIMVLGIALVAAMALTAQSFARGAPESFADLVEKLAPAVVNISTEGFVERQRGQRQLPPGFEPFAPFFRGLPDEDEEGEMEERPVRSLGSGFIISADGLVVTNNHVVAEADDIYVTFTDGTEYSAELVGADEQTDLAVLRIDTDEKLPFVPFGQSKKMRVGDWVVAIGNPFGLGGSVTAGILSAKGRTIQGSDQVGQFFQTDAPINRGNSGGPMFNLDGEVIGINSAIFSPSGGNVGIGFAIPSDFATKVIADLQEYGRFRRAYLGVNIQSADQDTQDARGIDIAGGAIIGSVVDGSPADKAGLKASDIIVSFDDQPVLGSSELVQMAAVAGVGRTVEVEFYRLDKKQSTQLTLKEFPRDTNVAAADVEEAETTDVEPTASEEVLGMEIAPLSSNIRERFRLPEDVDGTVVLDVSPRSEAARRGIRPGDVILEVNQAEVKVPVAVADEIDAARDRDRKAVLLYLYRNGNYIHVPVPINAG